MEESRVKGILAGFTVLLAASLNGAALASVGKPHHLFPIFETFAPGREVVLVTAGDCNGDGIEDLVVVYRESAGENRLVAVYSYEGGYRVSSWIKAPLENCMVQWKDIDEVPPVELLVSGQKGIHFGFAVFRFVDGEWVNLFGNNMEDCC